MNSQQLKLYPNERRAVRIIAKMQDRGKFEFTLDEFITTFKRYRKMRRQNITSMLRNLGRKLQSSNCRLDRTSRLGRNARARYRAEGYFGALIKKEGEGA